ncbi:MAG: hypothetical protein ACRCYU_07600 [Nocardioides sp.]
MNTEVLSDLLDSDSRLTAPRDAHNILAELLRIRLGHSNILSGSPLGQARSAVTNPCSRPHITAKTPTPDHAQQLINRVTH